MFLTAGVPFVQCLKMKRDHRDALGVLLSTGGSRALFPARILAASPGISIHIFLFFKLSVYLENLQDSPVNLTFPAKSVG